MSNVAIDLLLDCLHQDPTRVEASRLGALSLAEWEDLVALAAEQRVRPLLYRRLQQLDVTDRMPASVREQLQDACRQTALRTLRYYAETARIAARLGREGIDVLALKGVHLAKTVYQHAALREMNDIDLMVRPAHLPHAAAVLTSLGYESSKHIDIDVSCAVSHHLPPFVKSGVSKVEVHWNLTRPGAGFSIEPAELWQRARTMDLGGQTVQILAPEDLLLHLCQHASYHHQFGFGLRPFCDIATTVRHCGDQLDWDALCQRAEAWRWQHGVYLVLRLAQELVGAKVPPSALTRLQPSSFESTVLQAAQELVFTEKLVGQTVSAPLARLSEERTWWKKLRVILGRLFIPPVMLANAYSLPSHSPRLPLYYFVRAKDLLWRHGGPVLRLSQDQEVLKATAQRKYLINGWLYSYEESQG
jgi:hypothetical protein